MKILTPGVHPDLFTELNCRQCCTFLDETPMELQKTRRDVSKKVLEAPLDKVAIVDQVVDESKDTAFSPEMLESILTEFASQVATCSESEAVTSSKLHEILHTKPLRMQKETAVSLWPVMTCNSLGSLQD